MINNIYFDQNMNKNLCHVFYSLCSYISGSIFVIQNKSLQNYTEMLENSEFMYWLGLTDWLPVQRLGGLLKSGLSPIISIEYQHGAS